MKQYPHSLKVNEYVNQLPQTKREVVNYIRKIIHSLGAELGEQIKWNAPAFYYTGFLEVEDLKTYPRDILVLNLRKETILGILPTGAKLNEKHTILEGDYSDGRRMIPFKNLADAKAKEEALKMVILEWISLVKK